MAFNFPLNPTDGQVHTEAQADGSILTATYKANKNEWEVRRDLPAPTTITGNPPIQVKPTADGQVITWDRLQNKWVAKAPTASGGSGGTFSKGTQAAPDTPNPPDPTNPTQTLKSGMLQTTLENLHKEIKVWDGTAWVDVLNEDSIKQWIAAGSLFRSTLVEAGISALPAPANGNRGYYWTWAGASGYKVKATDTPLAPDLVNEILNPGDWLQSDGTKYTHVSGDLLSKQRWLALGSFTPWSDTSWEQGSLVSYQGSFFRSTATVQTGDDAPGGTNPGNKWVDITPIPHMTLEQLNNVNDGPAASYTEPRFLTYDINNNEWVASTTLDETSGISFYGNPGDVIDEFCLDFTGVNNADSAVPSVQAVKDYVAGIDLDQLSDCTALASSGDGDVPTWDAATSTWKPTHPSTVVSTNSIPFFRGKLSAGTTAPTGPAEGDIWVNQNNTPPTFDVYTSGAWVTHNFATATKSLGLLGDLANVSLGKTTVEQGDALIYDRATEMWTSGSVPAHIKKWSASTSYTSGTTIFHNGSLWNAAKTNVGVEPKLETGDVQFLYTDNNFNHYGPYIPSYFNMATDVTVAPTQVPTGFPASFWVFAIQYASSISWSVWKYNFTTTAWERITLGSVSSWQNKAEPPYLSQNNQGLLWIYGDTTATITPKVGQTSWAIVSIHTSLGNLVDTDISGLAKDVILQYDGAGKWRCVPLDIAKISDFSFKSLANGNILIYNAATQKWENKPERTKISDLTDTNAATPADGNILVYDNSQSKWAATAPLLQTATNVVSTRADASAVAGGDALVWDATNSTWRPAPLLQKTYNSVAPSATMGLTEAAIKTALDTKEPKLPAHVAADVAKILAVAADGSLVWSQPASSATTVLPPVATRAALPATANNGDIVVTLDDSNMYVWAGTPTASWHSIGGAAGGALPGLPATVTEALIPVGDTSRVVSWKPMKLQTLDDVDSTTSPEHGTTPVFNKLTNKFIFGQPDARIDNWAAGVTYSRDALVFHDGQVWRCRLERSLGDTPSLSNGQVSVYYTSATGRMSGPFLVSYLYAGDLDAQPTDTPTRNVGTHVALRYTSDSSYTIWTWELDLPYFQSNNAIRYHWVKVSTGGGVDVWRHPFHPPKLTGNNKARLWIFGDEAHTYAPITGSQNWEIVDFSSSLVSQRDVNALGATRGQVLVSDGAGKWNATTLPTLPTTTANDKYKYLQSDGSTFTQVGRRFNHFSFEDLRGFSGSKSKTFVNDVNGGVTRELVMEGWFEVSDTSHIALILEIGGVSLDFSTTSTDVKASTSMTQWSEGGLQSINHLYDGHGAQLVYPNNAYKVQKNNSNGWAHHSHIRLTINRTPDNYYMINSEIRYQSENSTPMVSSVSFTVNRSARASELITRVGLSSPASGALIQGQFSYEWS